MMYRAAFLLFLSALISTPAFAESAPQRGRTKDGRAYRIEKGMRLTDYIAELEVANDDLRRQLEALEDELDEKNKRLEGSAAPRPSAVRERDLVKDPPLPAARRAAACEYDSPANPFFNEKVKRIEAEDSIARLETELAGAREEISRLRIDLDSERSIAVTARSDLDASRDQARREQALREEETRRAEQALRDEQSARAALAAAVVPEPPVEIASKPDDSPAPVAESVGTASEAEAAAVKKDFREQLKKIQDQIVQRKNLFDSLKGRSKGVTINLQPLVAKDGRSLDALRIAVNELSPTGDIPGIRSGIADISSILAADIDVLRRLTK